MVWPWLTSTHVVIPHQLYKLIYIFTTTTADSFIIWTHSETGAWLGHQLFLTTQPKLARKTTPSMRRLDAFQEKLVSQKAIGSRRKTKNTCRKLVHVPAVPLSFIFVGVSRRGGRLRPLPATSTNETPIPAQGLCVWCTNRFHRL